jgi:cold shock CspA family protein
MAKSQESYNKKEKEKKRLKKKQDKLEKREHRKIERIENGPLSFEDMISYVDENGNLTSEKPDPNKKIPIKAEDIVLGASPRNNSAMDPNRRGKVKFFNLDKGYGFLHDSASQESIFVHINNMIDQAKEGDKVTFQIEMGPKGPSAINVELAK